MIPRIYQFAPSCALVVTVGPFLGLRATVSGGATAAVTHTRCRHINHIPSPALPPAITLHAVHLRLSGGLRHYHHERAAERAAVVMLLAAFQCLCVDNETGT